MPGEPILGERKLPRSQAQAWAEHHGATAEFAGLAVWYWTLAPPRGVRPEVLFAQSSVETGFGHFGGVIDASFHNPAGMKKHGDGGNTDPKAHARFPSWACGVLAHVDHLALYAGAPSYPLTDTPDGRHFPSLLGKGKTLESVAALYATDPKYAEMWSARLADLLGQK